MEIRCPAPPAVLVVALTAAPTAPTNLVNDALVERWGAVGDESGPYEFDPFTVYYVPEMGCGLVKRLVAFRDPISQETLAAVKLAANALESRWVNESGGRTVNLDPGYLTPHALVLASTKPASHRIYLRDGIYAEVTLRYERGTYAPLPWTYPDYRQPVVLAFLGRLRPAALALTPETPLRSKP
jgi:hypothetical protein